MSPPLLFAPPSTLARAYDAIFAAHDAFRLSIALRHVHLSRSWFSYQCQPNLCSSISAEANSCICIEHLLQV